MINKIYILILFIIILILILPKKNNIEEYNPLKKAWNSIKKMGKSIKNVGKIVKLLFQITKQGFKLLYKIILMMIEICQILYLILDKGRKCYKGFNIIYLNLQKEIKKIKNNLLKLKLKIKHCMNGKYLLDKTYYTNCIKSMFNIKKYIKNYYKRIQNIFNRPELFAQIHNNKNGFNKHYCKANLKNKKISKKFKYSKGCNQCFNYNGLAAKGYDQLLDVGKLIKESDLLFKKLNKLNSYL